MLGTGATPIRKWTFYLLAFISAAMSAAGAYAQSTPVDCSSYVTVTTANDRSVLDAKTRKITSTADVTIANPRSSGKTLLSPLHAVITINNANGEVTMPEALGGPSTSPYGKYYYDLTAKLTNGQLPPGASVTFSVKFVRASSVRYAYAISTYALLPASNQTPVANAGTDQSLTLSVGQSSMNVQLNGSGSLDPDGTIVAYAWSGSPNPDDIVNPTVALSEGTYTFALVVTDNNGAASQPSTVTITVNAAQNRAPVANAGANQTLSLPPGQETMSVQLDGSASSDADGSIAEYIWTGTPTPSAVAKPIIALGEGTHSFSLVVKDNYGAGSAAANVTITISTANPPQVHVSPLQYSMNQGETLHVAVTAVSPDARLVALSAAPALSNASFTASGGAQATGAFSFAPTSNQLGAYLVSFKATDAWGLEDSKTVQIIVGKVNHAPVIELAATAATDEGKALTIPVAASDPDGDAVTLNAAGLPDNAVFMPSAGTITFLPDYTQAGSYTITVTASDGALSASSSVHVTVKDIEPGSGAAPLTLTVDPVESPNFLDTQRITGRVNSTGSASGGLKAALIRGLSPAGGEQGTSLSVTLTGNADKYATHFESGKSTASFGKGITVSQLTVTSATSATALIQIDAAAAVGARQVSITTGNETALSVNAFSINKGTTSITGRIVDPVSGNGIAGAIVVVQGTNFTVTTDANGYFTLTGVSAGHLTLIVNAPNRESLEAPVEALPNAPVTIEDLKPKSTVFDASTAPSASVGSVIARGITGFTPTIRKDALKKLITDAVLLVGGNELGLLDEYGNQVNPEVADTGLLSVKAEGIARICDSMLRGETFRLADLLYSFSYSMPWGGTGKPLTLQQWIDGLQETANTAWNDPTNTENAMTILIFNSGQTLLPDAPKISPDTRLNQFQAFLLTNSLIAYMNTH